MSGCVPQREGLSISRQTVKGHDRRWVDVGRRTKDEGRALRKDRQPVNGNRLRAKKCTQKRKHNIYLLLYKGLFY